jgi:hypothetical protein
MKTWKRIDRHYTAIARRKAAARILRDARAHEGRITRPTRKGA